MYSIWKTFYILMVNADLKNVTDKNVPKLSSVNALHAGEFFIFFCHLLIFFFNYFSQNTLSRIPSEYQTFLIKFRPDTLWGLIWIQTVCEGYEQMTLADKRDEFCPF